LRHLGAPTPASELELFLVRLFGQNEVRIEQHGAGLAASDATQDGFDMCVAAEVTAALVDAEHEALAGEIGNRLGDLGARSIGGLGGGSPGARFSYRARGRRKTRLNPRAYRFAIFVFGGGGCLCVTRAGRALLRARILAPTPID
jgi:hypothetical protein